MGKKATVRNLYTYSGRIGIAIRERRAELGITVEELIDRLARGGVKLSKPSVYEYEQGGTQIPVNYLPAIAKALETTIRTFLPEN